MLYHPYYGISSFLLQSKIILLLNAINSNQEQKKRCRRITVNVSEHSPIPISRINLLLRGRNHIPRELASSRRKSHTT